MSATAVHPAAGSEYGPAPDRSLAQRLDALIIANDVRSRRAVLKRDIKAGRAYVIRLLVDPPEYILTMKIVDLLLAHPKWGRVRIRKVLSEHAISPSKTISGLSPRQRVALAKALGAVSVRRVP